MSDLVIDVRGALDDLIEAGDIDGDNPWDVDFAVRELAQLIGGRELAESLADAVMLQLREERNPLAA